MSYLVQIALGPIQGFIATARRSRDLWFGSYVLSELSKSAALSLANSHATLIFPATGDTDELKPGSDLLVVNIVTAHVCVADLLSAQQVLSAAKDAVAFRWKDLCAQAKEWLKPKSRSRDASRQLDLIRSDVWNAQIDDVVEFFVVAVPLVGQDGYGAANDRLRELMGQRKSTRCFAPYADTSALPKSSLDGARSTVLNEFEGREKADAVIARNRAGIEPTEQLDTPGIVKRVVGRERGFVPAARVAAEEWIQRVKDADSAGLSALLRAFDSLVPDGLVTKLEGKYSRQEEYGWVAKFAYDAQLLYPERIEAEEAKLKRALNLGGESSAPAWLGQAVANLRTALQPLYETLGYPQPYYAILLADGDRMGELIDRAAQARNGLEQHQKVSLALSAFARQVPETMASLGGACIYSGGDDVFGLVPLHKAVGCAKGLAKLFSTRMAKVATDLGTPTEKLPTLSVGLAVVHMLEPVADARELARQAEALAKGKALPAGEPDRNALGIIAKPRSGSAYQARIRWDAAAALDQLEDWQEKFSSGGLPGGLAAELNGVFAECAAVFSCVGTPEERVNIARLWRARVGVVLSKKQVQGGAALAEDLQQKLLDALCPNDPTDFKGRAPLDILLLARWLSTHREDAR